MTGAEGIRQTTEDREIIVNVEAQNDKQMLLLSANSN